MTKQELRRLIKLENRINQIAREQLGLSFPNIEYDVCPAEKFIEIMAYRGPSQISHWSYGKNYDKIRTIYDNLDAGLPYEVVIDSTPPRAYLLNKNVLAVHALVIAHVVGHVHFHNHNNLFINRRSDIMTFLTNSAERFAEYERRYGIENLEPVVDAGLALQFHTLPFDNETESQKLLRIYEQQKTCNNPLVHEYNDLYKSSDRQRNKTRESIEAFNNKLWLDLKSKSPIEPTGDLLRYIIDNSKILDDWQKDILETLREEGKYHYAVMKTKLMNEGFATTVHQKIMQQLFDEHLLTAEEHGQYAVANALVKAENLLNINPYLIGSKIWEDIETRWDKGQHGTDWDNCRSISAIEHWDTKEHNGWKKCLDVVSTHNDWLFAQEFLTNSLIDSLELFLYERVQVDDEIQLRRTKHTTDEIKQIIIHSYAQSGMPKIDITDGRDDLHLNHSYYGSPIDFKHAAETMKHIYCIWGKPVHLHSTDNTDKVTIIVDGDKTKLVNDA
jgi:stage V sporulation protein R